VNLAVANGATPQSKRFVGARGAAIRARGRINATIFGVLPDLRQNVAPSTFANAKVAVQSDAIARSTIAPLVMGVGTVRAVIIT